MKSLLRVIGWASVIAGLIMFVITLRDSAYAPAVTPNAYRFLAVGWLVSGIASAALFLGLADVIERLERIESGGTKNNGVQHRVKGVYQRGSKATYVPGWEPEDPK